jgi:hypothetical protein
MLMELLEHNGGRDEEVAGSNDHHLKGKGSKENTDVLDYGCLESGLDRIGFSML